MQRQSGWKYLCWQLEVGIFDSLGSAACYLSGSYTGSGLKGENVPFFLLSFLFILSLCVCVWFSLLLFCVVLLFFFFPPGITAMTHGVICMEMFKAVQKHCICTTCPCSAEEPVQREKTLYA